MSSPVTKYHVFIATPGGLELERQAFLDTIDSYNKMDAISRDLLFVPVGWEGTLRGEGRPQTLINEDLKQCDYFMLLLWDRWGTPPDKEGQGKFTSGTEEEFHLAKKCYRSDRFPMRQVIVLFKAVDPRQLSDPGEQLKKVLEFKQKLEREKELFFGTFDNVESFKEFLRRHLAQWVRDHERGGGKGGVVVKAGSESPAGASGMGGLVEPKTSGGEFSKMIEEAKRLADAGKLTEAEACFARVVSHGDEAGAFLAYGNFLVRVGRLAQAEVMYGRVLELAKLAEDGVAEAATYGNLGLIYQKRGDLPKAEEFHRKSLTINEKLGRLEGMAKQYGNLGLIYQKRGDQKGARQHWVRARDLYAQVGVPDKISLIQQWIDKLDAGEKLSA